MRALQMLPLVGWIVTRLNVSRPRIVVGIAFLTYASFIAFTFVQALAGRPFL